MLVQAVLTEVLFVGAKVAMEMVVAVALLNIPSQTDVILAYWIGYLRHMEMEDIEDMADMADMVDMTDMVDMADMVDMEDMVGIHTENMIV